MTGAYEPVSMDEGEEWLFRPVMRGMMRGEAVFDGSVDLAQIALFNEAIDVENENAYRRDLAAQQSKR